MAASNESIGMIMKQIRTDKGYSQQKVCELWPGSTIRADGTILCQIDRTVYAKYESGKLTPSDERISEFAQIFNLSPADLKQLYQKTAIVIPDTSALLNNSLLFDMMAEDFDQIIIANTVQIELSGMKNSRSYEPKEKIKKKKASQIIGKINELFEKQDDDLERSKISKVVFKKEDSESLEVIGDSNISLNDRKLIALAQKLQKKLSRKVYILHYDKDIPFFSDDSIKNIKLKDYIMERKKTPQGYQIVLDFDEEFDNIMAYEKAFESIDKTAIDAYLPNGMTLLTSCINCNEPERVEARGRRIPERLIKEKVKFLIKHNADLNKTDSNRYCHTPLEHCISLNPKEHGQYPFELFKMLIEAGADYNKCSLDETKQRDLRISEKNEGNTALMKACWECKKKFVIELLKKEDISINQQDCNGYTALTKCAVQRYNRISKNMPYNYYEELYKMLIEHGADKRIRDRNNRTALDWWNMGEDLLRKEHHD